MEIIAAPIQEYTTAAFRNAHFRVIGGIQEYYAPFARLEKGELPARVLNDLRPENNDGVPVVPQLMAKEADEAQRLIQLIALLGYRRMDFNFCCPFVKVVEHHYGAGLLASPLKVREILEAAFNFPDIQFSVKLRLGNESPREAQMLLPVLNEFPLYRIVLHPRTADQQYDGMPDRQAYEDFAGQCRCPVAYNGDIRCPEDALGLENIMIGRGLLSDPLLPRRLLGQTCEASLLSAFHQAYLEECQRLYQQPLQKLKQLWDYFLPETEKKLRKRIAKATTLEEYSLWTDKIIQNLK